MFSRFGTFVYSHLLKPGDCLKQTSFSPFSIKSLFLTKKKKKPNLRTAKTVDYEVFLRGHASKGMHEDEIIFSQLKREKKLKKTFA